MKFPYIPIKRQYWAEAVIKYLLLFAVFSAFNYWVLQHFFSFGQSILLSVLSAWKECGVWLEARQKRIFRVQPFSLSIFPNWQAICEDFKIQDLSNLTPSTPSVAEDDKKKCERIDLTFLRGELGKSEILYYREGFHTDVHLSEYGPSKGVYVSFRRVRDGYALGLERAGVNSSVATIPFQEFYPYDVDEDESPRLARKVVANRETARQEFGWKAADSCAGEKITHKYCEVYHREI